MNSPYDCSLIKHNQHSPTLQPSIMTCLSVSSSEQDSAPSKYNMSISEVADRIAVMQHQELVYRCNDYIIHTSTSYPLQSNHHPSSNAVNDQIDRECRVKMCEWFYQVVDACKFNRETVATSMSYFDRFLSTDNAVAKEALIDRKLYQLAAMTCLYTAVKINEPSIMDPALLSSISGGVYSEEDFVGMEVQILKALGWRVNGPTAHDFTSHLLALLPHVSSCSDRVTKDLVDFSRYQIEVAVSDYDLCLQKPSIVALAAILNSTDGIDTKLFTARQRFQYFQCITDMDMNMNPFSEEVNAVRMRLLKFPQISNLTPVLEDTDMISMSSNSKMENESGDVSPVTVARGFQVQDGCYSSARCA